MSGFQMPITIYQSMQYIDNNYYVLPAFQRDFVWSAEQIENLFDSIMRGYPTSSMLFWNVKGSTKTNWNFYKFVNNYVHKANDYYTTNELFNAEVSNDFYAILDGQQRLTAMRIGLFGSYSYHERNKSWNYSPTSFPKRRLYLCLSRKGAEEDECEYIFEFKKDDITKQEELYTDENGNLWFRVCCIETIHKNGLHKYLKKHDFEEMAEDILERLNSSIFDDAIITYYKEDEQNPDKAVKIFTRINSGGTKLEFSDIVFSLMVANWKIDAKTEIMDLKKLISQKGFDISNDYIIKAFLYLYHRSVKTEINSFSKDFCKKIEDNWYEIRNCMLSMFDLFKTFGLSSFTLTSNNATLPILYYLYHNNIYENYANKIEYKDERELIRKWLLSMIIRRTFGGQSDSILSQTRKAYTSDIDKSFLEIGKPFPVKNLSANIKKLSALDDEFLDELLKTQKDDRYAFPILALLYPDLDYKNNNFHKDHLHAGNLYNDLSDSLKSKYPFKEYYNSILNLQMLDANENESKSKKPLKQWVDEQTTKETREYFLKVHIIPNVDLSLSNFENFITKRKKMLKDKLISILE